MDTTAHPSPSTTLNGRLRRGPAHPSPSTTLNGEPSAHPFSHSSPSTAHLRHGSPAPRPWPVQLLADTRHTLLGLPLAVVSFSLVVTGLAAGLGAAVAGVGLFVLVGTLYAARGIAHVDRIRLADLTGGPVLRAPYRAPAPGAGPLRRALAPLACGRSWLEALHAVVRFPVALVAFVVTVTWWAGALAGLLYPLWGWSLYTIPGYTDLGSQLSMDHPLVATALLHMAAGALFLLTLPAVVRACAYADASVGRALLLLPEDPRVRVYTAPADRVPAGV
ncbi:sensor domain-containing protein [Nocardiopsis changdeensis]|uniref:sensor domain-containing protein n=1 Tax=Nocardiopsis TaxID=2013 RepID=UPI002102DB23|nr:MULTISPECIES: sensor domain-containing protein [Nocardiopsis]